MPSYDYRCDDNDRVLEVRHRMSESITTWGELCDLAGVETGSTDAQSPVTKLLTGGNVVKSSSLRTNEPPCASGSPCSGGGCEFS